MRQGENSKGSSPRPASGEVITMVCVTCGAEQFFDVAPPGSLKCTKCTSTVFRAFATPVDPDEVRISALEQQARSIQYGDSSPQTSPDEVRDVDAR